MFDDDTAPNTYSDSDYDPTLLDSYSEEEVDRRSFRQALLPSSIIPDPVIIPSETKGKFLVLALSDPEIIHGEIFGATSAMLGRICPSWLE